MVNDLAFCSEMRDIKSLLAAIAQAKAGGDDLYMQYPLQTADLELPANTETSVCNTTIRRILKFIGTNAPDGIVIEIYKDNELWMLITDDSGSMEFEGGIYFDDIAIVVRNTTNYPLRWSVKLAWGGV